jgi:hypothetical protein
MLFLTVLLGYAKLRLSYSTHSLPYFISLYTIQTNLDRFASVGNRI